MKKAYHYFFYKIYKSLESSNDVKFLLDWKAAVIIDFLEIFLGFSLIIYYSIFSGNSLNLDGNIKLIVLVYIFVIGIPNYFIFQHNENWKRIIDDFDKSVKKKDTKGSLVVWSVAILIVANFIFSYSLLLNQAKKNHTGPYSPEYLEQQK